MICVQAPAPAGRPAADLPGEDPAVSAGHGQLSMRLLLILIGHLCVAVGMIGIFVPLLPTTPFLLLAAACYAKGSPRFKAWLEQHPRLGPPVVAWRERGVIRPRAKLLACLLITLSLSIPLIFADFDWRLKACAAAVGLGAMLFIISRPNR